MMLTDKRKEELHNDFYRALVDDRDWHDSTTSVIQRGDYNQFSRTCRSAMLRIERHGLPASRWLKTAETEFLTMKLWEENGGSNEHRAYQDHLNFVKGHFDNVSYIAHGTDTRKNWLIKQYVEVMWNDETVRTVLTIAAQHNNYGQHRRIVTEQIRKIRLKIGDGDMSKWSADCYVFIHMSLWQLLGMNPKDALKDPGTTESAIRAYLAGHSPYQDVVSGAVVTMNLVKSRQNDITGTIQFKQEFGRLTIQENTMQNTPFITKTYIFGVDSTLMTEDQLIAAIKRIEQAISCLKEVKTKSKTITAKIAAQEASLKQVVDLLDAKQ